MEQLTYISILEMREQRLSTLYWNFAESFPGFDTFWLGLSGDKQKQKAIVGKLREEIDEQQYQSTIAQERFDQLSLFYKNLDMITQASNSSSAFIECPEAVWLTLFLEAATMKQLEIDVKHEKSPEVRLVIEKLYDETVANFGNAQSFAQEYELEQNYYAWSLGHMIRIISERIEAQGLEPSIVWGTSQ